MTWRSSTGLALVAALAASTACRADADPPSSVEAPTAAWASETVSWMREFRARVERLGGLGAAPFLAPEVVVDVRTIPTHPDIYEGVDEAITFFFEMQARPGSPAERWSFDDLHYVDTTGIVVPGAYDRSVRPGVTPRLPAHSVLYLDVGDRGIERFQRLPSTASWRQSDKTGVTERADEAERIVGAWVAAWSGDDRRLVDDLYAPDAALEDDLAGVDLVGARGIADRWAMSPETSWEVIERDGTRAVHLWAPQYGADSRSVAVLALVRGDAGEGCPGALAVWWELDGDGRVARERRLRSVPDTRRCLASDELPDGWWTGRAIRAGRQTTTEDLETVTDRIVQGDRTTEIRNGTPVLTALVSWALARFDLAGLRVPVVPRVTFTSSADYCDDAAGRTMFLPDLDPATPTPTEGSWEIVLCLESDDAYIDEGGTEPSPRSRYVVLHELAHVWIEQHVDPPVRDYFAAWLGLPTWSGAEHDWDRRAVEWAASFIAWGLMDDPLPIFELGIPPLDQRLDGFQMLTSRQPLQQGG